MTAFEDYVDQYGLHFSRRLYEWAVSMMSGRKGESAKPVTKEQVKSFLETHGVNLERDKGYDAAYVYSMARSDYFGSSIPDDLHLALFVKDYLDDPDGSSSKAFDHFVVDCRAKKEPIFWDEML